MTPPHLIVWTGPSGSTQQVVAWTLPAARALAEKWGAKIYRLEIGEEIK